MKIVGKILSKFWGILNMSWSFPSVKVSIAIRTNDSQPIVLESPCIFFTVFGVVNWIPLTWALKGALRQLTLDVNFITCFFFF